MRTMPLQVPLRVYTRSGALITQIGEQRRVPVSYEEIPQLVREAFWRRRMTGFSNMAGSITSACCVRFMSI